MNKPNVPAANWPAQISNGDEDISDGDAKFIGNFHKSQKHNKFGEVDEVCYRKFQQICASGGNFENVCVGPLNSPDHGPWAPDLAKNPLDGKEYENIPLAVDKLVNPQAGFGDESWGPHPRSLVMRPAPNVRSVSTAAEMTELYWMAFLRDLPFQSYHHDQAVLSATGDLQKVFGAALAEDSEASVPGKLQLRVDLPDDDSGRLDLRVQTLFRCGLRHEDCGPLVSQFFLHDVPYGTQIILQRQRPYRTGQDYLTNHTDWLRAQDTGYDSRGIGYGDANGDRLLEPGAPRRFRNMRDLARFVHKDALHQAYFNAALLLLGWKADLDRDNPYCKYTRQREFGSLGGPHLLTLVSEVASRALKVVWLQKWHVHRRLRPEAYGGLLQMQINGYEGEKKNYSIPDLATKSPAAKSIMSKHGTLFLPMAFSSGSPVHPAYGAGHATVAGACVTILKAWFDEDQKMVDLLHRRNVTSPITNKPLYVVEPDAMGSDELPPYLGADLDQMTVGGELNKIASNVAMGRSMGGVHWRSDNTRSLRLGEKIAAFILAKVSSQGTEKFPDGKDQSWSFTSFNRSKIEITCGKVFKNNAEIDPLTTDL